MHMLVVFVVHVRDYFFCASAICWGERLVGGTEDVCLGFEDRVLVVWIY